MNSTVGLQGKPRDCQHSDHGLSLSSFAVGSSEFSDSLVEGSLEFSDSLVEDSLEFSDSLVAG